MEASEKLYLSHVSANPYNGLDFDFAQLHVVRAMYRKGEPWKLFELVHGLDRLATDPRDLVFALVGISDDPGGTDISYKKTVGQVYEEAAKRAIAMGRADLVFQLRRYPPTMGMPTWVPDWRQLPPSSPLAGHSCATSSSWTIEDGPGPGLLTLQGACFSTVEALGDAAGRDDVRHFELLVNWEQVVLRNYVEDVVDTSCCSILTETCKMLSANMPRLATSMSICDVRRHWEIRYTTAATSNPYDHGSQGRSFHMGLANTFAKNERVPPCCTTPPAPHGERTNSYPSGCSNAEAYFQTLLSNRLDDPWGPSFAHDWISLFTNSEIPVFNETYGKPWPYEFFRLKCLGWNDIFSKALYTSVNGRRFVVLANKYMGLVPAETQLGDRICVFFGSSNPIVLRAVGDQFEIVGECYLHGIMDGELFHEGKLVDGYTVEKFCLR